MSSMGTALEPGDRLIDGTGAYGTVRIHNTDTDTVAYERDDYSLSLAPRGSVWAV